MNITIHASTLLVTLGMLASNVVAKPRQKESKAAETTVHDHRSSRATKPAAPRSRPAVTVHSTIQPEVGVHSSSTSTTTAHSADSREVVYQQRETEPRSPTESVKAWHLGIGIGTGPTLGSASDSGITASLDGYVGLRLNSFALGGQYWGTTKDYFEPGSGATQTLAMFTAQIWMQERMWIKMGIGSARLYDDKMSTAKGTALMAGAGYDLLDTRHFVVNLHAKLGSGLYRTRGIQSTVSGGVGLVWY